MKKKQEEKQSEYRTGGEGKEKGGEEGRKGRSKEWTVEKDWGPPTHSERSGWKVVGGGAKRSILRPQSISLGVVQWIPGVLFGESFFPKVLEAPLGIPHIDAPGSAGIFWRGVCGCVCPGD